MAEVAAQKLGNDQQKSSGHRAGKHPAGRSLARVRMAAGVLTVMVMAMRMDVHCLIVLADTLEGQFNLGDPS